MSSAVVKIRWPCSRRAKMNSNVPGAKMISDSSTNFMPPATSMKMV